MLPDSTTLYGSRLRIWSSLMAIRRQKLAMSEQRKADHEIITFSVTLFLGYRMNVSWPLIQQTFDISMHLQVWSALFYWVMSHLDRPVDGDQPNGWVLPTVAPDESPGAKGLSCVPPAL